MTAEEFDGLASAEAQEGTPPFDPNATVPNLHFLASAHASQTSTQAVDCFGITDVGRVRSRNEDQFIVMQLDKVLNVQQTSLEVDRTPLVTQPEAHLAAVADGMGGHSRGDLASGIAVTTVMEYALQTMPWFFSADSATVDFDGCAKELSAAIERAETRIWKRGKGDRELEGMGTTISMAFILWPNMFVLHVGDSRIYRLRDGSIEQLTKDHTVAQQLVDSGDVTEEEAKNSPMSNVLSNALGGNSAAAAPEVHRHGLKSGDVLVLCTDGLTRYVDDDEINTVVSSAATSEGACNQLVAMANEAGGSDNITVVVSRFLSTREEVEAKLLVSDAPEV